jgi:hypothetical protein
MLPAQGFEGGDRPPLPAITAENSVSPRDSGRLSRENAFVFSCFDGAPHACREQNNRENNRTVTGAYQDDNRREDNGGRLQRRSHMSGWRYAKCAMLRGRAAAALIHNGATMAARPQNSGHSATP